MTTLLNYDAVILGAGPAGATTAILLSQKGWKVALLDRASEKRDRVCGGFLGPEIAPLLEKLEISDLLEKVQAKKVNEIGLSGFNSPEMHSSFEKLNGWGVNRIALDHYLIEKAKKLGAQVFLQSQLQQADKRGDRIYVQAQNHLPFSIETRYLIRATGRRSPAQYSDKTFFACKTTYQSLKNMNERVVLHFVRGGHVGFNQLGEDTFTMCLYFQRERLQETRGDLDQMMNRVALENKSIAAHLEGARRIGSWQSCPAEPDHDFRFYDGLSYYVGDAVSMVNPIIGGGIAIALGSAYLLAQSLLQYRGKLPDIKIGKKYEQLWKHNYWLKVQLGRLFGWCEARSGLAQKILHLLSQTQSFLNYLVHFSRPCLSKS